MSPSGPVNAEEMWNELPHMGTLDCQGLGGATKLTRRGGERERWILDYFT